jgi:uncharacterized DUF497 family protein
VEFDWDEGNRGKNLRHGVHDWEIEEAFEDPHRRSEQAPSVDGEDRWFLLARVGPSGRYLRIVYTVRIAGGREFCRPISALEMPRNARRRYRR